MSASKNYEASFSVSNNTIIDYILNIPTINFKILKETKTTSIRIKINIIIRTFIY